MPGPAAFDDATVEAFLSGRPLGAGELGPLAAFADDVRVAVDGPPPAPTAEMASLLTEGIPTPTGATRAALAPRARTRDAHVSKRRKRMLISELLAGLLAKLAGLGAASKAALGLGMAAASVTGAGAAGILPDPAQHAVATAVSAATPFEIDDPDDVVAGADDTENGDDTGGDTGGDDADTAVANHGACVSEAAHNAPRGPGGEHGRAVSAIARSDCGKSSASTTVPSSTTTTSSVTTTTIDGDEEETSIDANRGPGGPGSSGNPHHGNSGPGNSGNGGGNSGPGNSGNGGGNSGPGNSGSGPGNSGNGGGQGSGR